MPILLLTFHAVPHRASQVIDPQFANRRLVLHIGNVFTNGLSIRLVQSLQPFTHRLVTARRSIENCRKYLVWNHGLVYLIKYFSECSFNRLVWVMLYDLMQGVDRDLVPQATDYAPNVKTIHPHPTLGESIGIAAEVAHGSCTDLPPARK